MTNHSATAQTPTLLAAEVGVSASRTPQLVMLVALEETVYAPSTRIPQTPVLVAVEQVTNPRTPQAFTLVAYGEGSRENNTLRAWSFTMDSHVFYVLHLGELGTWVCDLSSGYQWSKWETQGMENWNAEEGLMWDNRIVAGDSQNPILWLIDPEAENDQDDTKGIYRLATAIVPVRGRKNISCGMLSINAAAGYPSETGAELSLRFSDDNGETWVEMDPITFEAGAFDQNLQFGSLGTFGQPGRIFEISDIGGTMRLSDVDAEFDGNDPWGDT